MKDLYTDIFKILSDTTRLKIVWILINIDSKICVSEIIEVLDEHQYNVSRHLRILKDAGFLEEMKEGRWVYYQLKQVNSKFERLIYQAVESIPLSEMEEEAAKCKLLLATRN